ncbi:Hsp70 family protein [Dactylosporangium sp. NPDC048998]|uniref:Hsp70 family protein n=1 Tax=Dactylosporangium sp. NPDC048998 TaxID=3363976 RepID=UPI003713727F
MGPARRATLRSAAHDAGFAAPAMLAEPVAAARYHLDAVTPPGAPAVVFDLGGGTFDVCLVRSGGEEFEILASDGLADLGGVDLDAIVVDLVAESAKAADPEAWARLLAPSTPPERRHFRALWDRARQAKESLSRRSSVTVAVPLLDREAPVTREQFERAAAPMLSLAVDQTLGLLRRAGLDPAALGGIFLVGGATRTPLVGTLLHRATGRPPTVLDQPELVVAEGALRTGPRPAAAPPDIEQPSPEQAPWLSAQPASSQGEDGARPEGAPVQVRWQRSRGRALAGAAFWAAFVVCGLWYAIANSGTLDQQTTAAKVIGIGLLVACFVFSMGDLARAAAPDTLVVDGDGIHLQRLRPGRGIQRLSLPWAQIAEASVAQVDMLPHLVVRTKAGPVDGAALTGTRYRTDVSGFALCRLTEVGAPAEDLRKALAAFSGETPGDTPPA